MTADAQAAARALKRINPMVQFKVTAKEAMATVDMALAPPTSSIDKSSGKARAVPSLMDEDSDGEPDHSAAFAQTHDVRVAPPLPNLSDDEDDVPKGAPSAAPKRKRAPRAPRAPKIPETEEQKAERKLRKELERREKKQKEADEARRKVRVDAGTLLAEALTVLSYEAKVDDSIVPLGERWKVDKETRCMRAEAVHGVRDIAIKRKVLDDSHWLPPGFKRDDSKHVIYIDSEAVKTKAELDKGFLDRAAIIKDGRKRGAHERIGDFLKKKRASAASEEAAP